ncbi:MAG TPA: hypothetical protein VNF69_13705 [Burkholderiales bacterium]|nr:hypothetical protein [Burkholderiales bacterium]
MARKSILSKLRLSEESRADEQDPTEALSSAALEPSLATVEGQGAESPAAETSVAVVEALSETEEAAHRATEALAAEGVRVASRAPEAQTGSRHERPRKTKAQLMRAAKTARDFRRKLLAHRTGGFASRLREVQINNGVLAAAFERFFPVIERCTYLLARHGGAALGDASAEKLLERIREMTEEIHADRAKELEAAQAYNGEQSVKMGDRFITPGFTAPALTGTVQLRTPQADRALDIFLISDQVLTEFETLYWNQLRSVSDRNDQMLRSKKVVRPLFAFAAATTRNLYRRMRDQAGAAPTQSEAAPGLPAPERAEPAAQDSREAALAA